MVESPFVPLDNSVTLNETPAVPTVKLLSELTPKPSFELTVKPKTSL